MAELKATLDVLASGAETVPQKLSGMARLMGTILGYVVVRPHACFRQQSGAVVLIYPSLVI